MGEWRSCGADMGVTFGFKDFRRNRRKIELASRLSTFYCVLEVKTVSYSRHHALYQVPLVRPVSMHTNSNAKVGSGGRGAAGVDACVST